MTGDHLTTVAATGAIASPWWLPTLQGVSETCATWAPILGVLWLLIQMVSFLLKKRRAK